MNPKISSSINATQLSNTIKGLIISLSSVITFVASFYFHETVSQYQILAFADQIANTISAIGIAYGMIHTLFGLILKIVHKVTVEKSVVTSTN